MRKIYVDSANHCHTTNPDGKFREIETGRFDGMCDIFVEGYCYQTIENGYSFYPWKLYDELDAAQRQYERALIADMQSALNKLGVNLDG